MCFKTVMFFFGIALIFTISSSRQAGRGDLTLLAKMQEVLGCFQFSLGEIYPPGLSLLINPPLQ